MVLRQPIYLYAQPGKSGLPSPRIHRHVQHCTAEILWYLNMRFVSTLAVLPNVMVHCPVSVQAREMVSLLEYKESGSLYAAATGAQMH